MLGSGLGFSTLDYGGTRSASVPRCLTFQQQVRRHKMRADWAFVSGVSAVSANWEIINRRCKRQRELLLAATPCALGQVRHAPIRPAFLVRQQGRDTGGTAETARVCPLLLLQDYHDQTTAPRSAADVQASQRPSPSETAHHRLNRCEPAAVPIKTADSDGQVSSSKQGDDFAIVNEPRGFAAGYIRPEYTVQDYHSEQIAVVSSMDEAVAALAAHFAANPPQWEDGGRGSYMKVTPEYSTSWRLSKTGTVVGQRTATITS